MLEPQMRITRTVRLLGYALLAVVVAPLLLDPSIHFDRRLGPWLAAYAMFGLAFHFGASAAEGDRRRRVLSLLVMTPSMLSMAALLPCHFGSLSLVIVASQAALVLPAWGAAAWIAAQTVLLGFLLVCSSDLQDGLATMIALSGFQSFAAVAVYSARREAEATRALERTNAELRATRSLLEEASRVNERTRIARELHDVLGHDLTALGLQLEVATHVPAERAAAHVGKAQEVSARLLDNVRQVVTAMKATSAPDLSAALRALVGGTPGVEVHLELPEALCVDESARAHCILRCVQEIVTNTMRHARARNLWIAITQGPDGAITVDARDDGCGATTVQSGHGLSGMRARLEELGGRLRVQAEPAQAFALSAWLPAKGAS
jgi:signal transduction histidine kinase